MKREIWIFQLIASTHYGSHSSAIVVISFEQAIATRDLDSLLHDEKSNDSSCCALPDA